MRIVFFTQEDPFYVKIFFDEFLQNYNHLNEVKAVVISHAMGRKSLVDLGKQMFSFYGPFDFLRMGFRFAYTKLMSKRDLSKGVIGIVPKTHSIKQTATVYGIDTIERSDLNSQGFLSLIKQYDPDLFISVASPIIFKEALINIPKMGCINIHNAPLPKYRGMLPNFWQMYHDEKAVGITIHEINPRIDEGRILLQKDVDIRPNETLDSLIKRTKGIGAHFMIDVINMIKCGSVKYLENDPAKGSYFSFPTREDVKELKRRGKRII